MQAIDTPSAQALDATMASIIQRIATGPDLSKDIEQEEARLGMQGLLQNAVDPVATLGEVRRTLSDAARTAEPGSMEALRLMIGRFRELLDVGVPRFGGGR